MGQGFKISKNRNNAKPTNSVCHVTGIKNMVINKPTNSSHTIAPWSGTPASAAALPQRPPILPTNSAHVPGPNVPYQLPKEGKLKWLEQKWLRMN